MDTKTQIVSYATTLLMQSGYYGWSYEHISKKIGIKKASIHYYFPTKESLVLEVLQRYINAFFTKLKEVSNKPITNLEKLQILMSLYKANYENKDEICLCTMLASDVQRLTPEISNCLKNFNTDLVKWLTQFFQKGVESHEFRKNLSCESAAYMLVSILHGLLVTSKLPENEHVFESCMEQIYVFIKPGAV